MSEKAGGIDYTPEEYLIRGAQYASGGNYTTELMIPYAVENDDEEIPPEKQAAERIRRLVCDERLPVTDKESGKLRPVRYGDVAVLAPGWADCSKVEKALNSIGIPAMCEKSCHYLDSIEVSTIMAFLQIIDKPCSGYSADSGYAFADFAFSGDELAEIRACCPEGRFYDAVCAAAESKMKNSGI